MGDLITDLHWNTVRLQAIEQFNGETPRTDTEAAIIDVFELAPRAVVRAIQEVGEAVRAGQARSGWAILRKRLEGSAQPVRDVTVKSPDERARKIRQAETMIRNAGRYDPADRADPDHSSELDDEIFGDRGILKPWADDHALRERMQALWRELRPPPEPAPAAVAALAPVDDWVADEREQRA